MAYYIHRERYIADVVPPKSIITFPTLVNESLNRAAFRNIPPYKNMEEEEWRATIVNDIYYHGCTLSPQTSTDIECEEFYSTLFEGAFDINLPGVYLISWYVSQTTGLAPDGCFFQVKYYDYENQQWKVPSAGSRLLVSASEFYTVINVQEGCFPEPDGGKLTLALFNESDEPLFMNRTPELKAGFAIFGFSPVTDKQLEEIYDYIAELMEDCCGMGDNAHALACLKWQLTKIEAIERDQDDQLDQLKIDWDEFYKRFLQHISDVIVVDVPTIFGSSANGALDARLNLRYLRNGYLYHIWLSGSLNVDRNVNITSGKVWITPRIWKNPISPYEERNLLPFLEFFDRPVASVGSFCHIAGFTSSEPLGSAAGTTRRPLYIDSNGIYLDIPPVKPSFSPGSQDVLSFSTTLVLEVN